MKKRKATDEERLELFRSFVGMNDCILKVNGKYFGYDTHPQYPEATFDDINDAYIFRNPSNVLDLLKWYPHKTYEIIQLG